MSRLTSLVLVISAAALGVGAAVIGWSQWQAHDEAQVASVGSRPSVSTSVAATSPPSDVASPGIGIGPSAGTTPTPVEATYPVPRRVRIPAIDVATRVVPVGLEKDGAIEIPDDIRLVGWYDLGVPPGAPRGSAVLVAHRDGRAQGRGVFYDLGRLDVGDRVTVRTDGGEDLAYSVVSRESIRKRGLPYDELFAIDGPPRLTLISCGGYYDPDRGGYQDNVVVTAVPQEAGARG